MTTYASNAFASARTPRIFCIGRNYADHIAEMGHGEAQAAVVFMKPIGALVASGQPLPLPTDQGEVHYEAELVVELGTGGRHITADAAAAHIAGLGLGLDLTLRSLQKELIATGEPWEKSKGFDCSAPLGPLRAFDTAMDLEALEFRLEVNGELRQHGRTQMMLVDIRELIVQLSAHWELLPGDLIYTGTPEGVGEVRPGDRLELHSDALPGASWQVTAAE
ncbi:MAG TPA: fumarylacetoacetate hydrolase family protein [Salinisphaeraceae bacterium]|nr:fumarylacetoacetate hydrolase family protein [Salinisphaeraceae bacterium]